MKQLLLLPLLTSLLQSSEFAVNQDIIFSSRKIDVFENILPPDVRKRVGTTRITMKSPRVFTQNLSIHTVNTDSKKYLVFMQKTDLGIYSVAEEIHRKWSPIDLKENAMMYFDRFKTKQTNAKILKVVSTKVQGWPDVRLDGQCTIQGSTMLFTWLGFRDGDTSWIVKAHYVEYNQSIAKAESMMASIAISDN